MDGAANEIKSVKDRPGVELALPTAAPAIRRTRRLRARELFLQPGTVAHFGILIFNRKLSWRLVFEQLLTDRDTKITWLKYCTYLVR